MVYLRPFVIGLASYLPASDRLFARRGTGVAVSPEYYYGVWIKHLTTLWSSGLRSVPVTLAELGPGDTLGVGIAALLSGVQRYYALDVVRFTNTETNLKIFDAMVELLRRRAPRPHKGWPDIDDELDANLFPSHILTDDLLNGALAPERVAAIRRALIEETTTAGDENVVVRYIVPWNDSAAIAPGSVEVVVSHVVLQAVQDLDGTYAALAQWLPSGGWMSHHIDFSSQRTARVWNGHWSYGENVWRLVAGRRPSLTNREPHSTHVRLMEQHGFEIVSDLQRYRASEALVSERLAARWQQLSDDDRTCESALIQARKR